MYTYIFNAIRSFAEKVGLLKKSSELDKVDDLIKEIDEPIEKGNENKHIYRTFNVKAPYSGPPQIMLLHDEELVLVHENGQYISMHVTNFEDYGTDDEEEKIKVIYNIVVDN
jgi:hypothetical protein